MCNSPVKHSGEQGNHSTGFGGCGGWFVCFKRITGNVFCYTRSDSQCLFFKLILLKFLYEKTRRVAE